MELNELDKVEPLRYIKPTKLRIHRKNATEYYLNMELKLEDWMFLLRYSENAERRIVRSVYNLTYCFYTGKV